MKKLWFEIFYTSSAKIFSLVTGMAVLIITARWLGPEGRGIIAAVTTWAGLFATCGHLSLGQVSIHLLAGNKDKTLYSALFGNMLLLTVIITLLGWIVATILYNISNGNIFNNIEPLILFVGFLSLPFLIWEQYSSLLLSFLNEIKIYNNSQIIAQSCSVFFLLVVLFFNWGIPGVLTVILSVHLIIALTCLKRMFKRSDYSMLPDTNIIKALISGGGKLHLNAIGTYLIMSTDILIINHYCGAAATGYYQLDVQLINTLMIIPGSATLLLFGKVSQSGSDNAWQYQRKILLFLSIGMALLALIAAMFASILIPFVVGDDFIPAVQPFILLLPALIGMTFSSIMAPQWIARGLFWQVSALTLLIGIGNLILSLVLVPEYGIYGAVWGTLITYTISVIINGGMACWCELRYRKNGILN
ncbi:MAG: oligosaccharide flippase family protein [Thermodesulfobacteriota bacterium]|nr:oligosaccharide flippase family protein [Thermodesulfobacteriota bacterium]